MNEITRLASDVKFFESYSRYIEQEGRYETWSEAVDRVMDTHKIKYKDVWSDELDKHVAFATELYRQKRVLGAQRMLQFGGKQILKNEMKIYNCAASYADRPEFFGEIFFLLLCGSGAGFSVQKHHVNKLPSIAPRTKHAKIFNVPDSIEGWATAVDVLMSSYFEGGGKYPEYQGRRVFFDLTSIRPKGSKISGGFKAPGPDPLRRALDRIEMLIENRLADYYPNNGNVYLRPIDVYDIVMHVSDAVLSGGVRRSATICLFSIDDEEMINAKTGNWFEKNPQRARSNNSALIVRNQVTEEQFNRLMRSVREFGEPGFVFTNSTEHVTNPCVVGNTKLLTKNGYFSIKELVGDEVEIWNGNEWSKVVPFSTGVNELMEITFSNGAKIKCTPYHNFMLSSSYGAKTPTKTEAKNLKIGDKLWKYDMPVISSGGVTYDVDAYSQGFYSGDGTKNSNVSWIYYPKLPCINRLKGKFGKYYDTVDRQYWNHGNMLPKNFVPMDATFDYKINWLSGLFDADGCVTRDKNGNGLQLVSIDKNFLNNVRLLLTTLGVQAKIIKASDGGLTDFKGRGGVYKTKSSWRILVGNQDTYSLLNLGVKFERLDAHNNPPQRDARQFVKVIKIKKLNYSEETFCVTDPLNNTVTLNGIVTGNCVEIGLYPVMNGHTGWEMCNLTEINGASCITKEIFYENCRAASILGTLQAGYTKSNFLPELTKNILEREALLGVSITGWMNSPKILFDEDTLREGANIVKETNKIIADLLGINQAARTTCVKPSGNASVLLGTSSGIHPEHSRQYIRNMQINKDIEIVKHIKSSNPYMVEESVWSASNTDYVVSFPIIANSESIIKKDLTAIDMLEKVKFVQKIWVESGTNIDLCVEKDIRHNVSNTITVKSDEWDEVEKYIFNNKDYFAGVSLLSDTGDKDYYQSPFIEVLNENELVEKYGVAAIFASGLIVDSFKGFSNLWEAVNTVKYNGSVDQEKADIQADWIRRFKKFADNYFNGEISKTEYCLKDVATLHKWVKINQNFNPINVMSYTKQHEVDIDTMGAQACAGGACEISFDTKEN